MSYKNTVKIFTSNFMLVWKQMLYLFVCGLIFALCTYATITPIISLLRANNIFVEIKNMIDTVYNSPSEFALVLSDLSKHTLSVIVSNFSSIWAHLIALVIFAIFLPYILIQMSYYNICSIINQKISMNHNAKYFQNGLRTFKQSIIYSLASIIFNLPFWALSILFIVIYLVLAKTIVTAIIGFVILSLLLILQKSFKYTLLSCYTGYMVKNDAGPFVSMGKGLIIMFKSFGRVLSNSIVIMFTIILINGFTIVFTFFSGLILTIPSTFVFLAIFYMVTFYGTNGERYYINANFIYNPSKYSVSKNQNELEAGQNSQIAINENKILNSLQDASNDKTQEKDKGEKKSKKTNVKDNKKQAK